MSVFEDRRHAGRVLAAELQRYRGRPDLLVLALPRGGVPVAYEVAQELAAPLDVFVVRKLGAPDHEELAMGAIASGGMFVLNDDIVRALHVSTKDIERVAKRERRELARREAAYRGQRGHVDVAGRTVILVDDGLATGASMRAAVRALRALSPMQIIAAVPVAAADSCAAMTEEADTMVCAATPEPFDSVGLWYRDFGQTSDDEVRTLLDAAKRAEQAELGGGAGLAGY